MRKKTSLRGPVLRVPFVLAALVLMATAAAAAPAAVRAQGPGVLEGMVVNGTPGAAAGEGLVVTLWVMRGGSEVDKLTASTGAEGHFRFEGLDTSVELEYWPEVVYEGVSYGPAEAYRFGGAQGALLPEATLTVYETTDDDSGLTLAAVHLIAESFGQVLRITEVQLLTNPSGRTYVGRPGEDGQAVAVAVPLPAEAVGLAFDDEAGADNYREIPGGLAYTGPVRPGAETAAILFSYHLPVRGKTVTMERSFAYPVGRLSLLAAQPGLKVRSGALLAMGAQSFQGQQYELYTAEGLTAGAPLAMEFVPQEEAAAGRETSGAPVAGGPSPEGHQALLRKLGLGLVGLALAGAVAYPLAVRRR